MPQFKFTRLVSKSINNNKMKNSKFNEYMSWERKTLNLIHKNLLKFNNNFFYCKGRFRFEGKRQYR